MLCRSGKSGRFAVCGKRGSVPAGVSLCRSAKSGRFGDCRKGQKREKLGSTLGGGGLGLHGSAETWTWYTYDVWGNEEDGFEVNETFRRGSIQLPANADEDAILPALRKAGYLSSGATKRTVEVDWGDEGWIELTIAKNGKPLGRLTKE